MSNQGNGWGGKVALFLGGVVIAGITTLATLNMQIRTEVQDVTAPIERDIAHLETKESDNKAAIATCMMANKAIEGQLHHLDKQVVEIRGDVKAIREMMERVH